MKVNLQAVHFKADKKLIDYIQKKMDKLDLFFDRVIDSDVFLQLENTTDKENKTVEIRLKVPGEVYLVKKTAASFEEAVDTAADSMRRKLRKFNEKTKEHH